MKRFAELSEAEILALAISLEEEDERVYADFADGLRETFPATAKVLEGMGAEESAHRQSLTDLFKQKFGDHIPLIRRQDVKGFVQRKPVWLVRPLGLDAVRRFAAAMEMETEQFYARAPPGPGCWIFPPPPARRSWPRGRTQGTKANAQHPWPRSNLDKGKALDREGPRRAGACTPCQIVQPGPSRAHGRERFDPGPGFCPRGARNP